MKDSIRKKRHSDDPRSIMNSYTSTKSSQKVPQNTKILQMKIRKENYQSLMKNSQSIIDQLFLPSNTKAEVERSFKTAYHLGFLLTSEDNPKENFPEFFSSWLKTAEILSNYYAIPTSRRLQLFFDDSINLISKTVEPLNNFSKNDDSVFTQMKIEKSQHSFQTGLENMIQVARQYFKGQISFETISRTVRDMLNDITSLDNFYFRQSRKDTKDIGSMVQVMFNQILNAIYDYSNQDRLAVESMNNLNSITNELKALFISPESNSNENNLKKSTKKKKTMKIDEMNFKALPSKPEKVQKTKENDETVEKVVPLRRRSGESVEMLKDEIDELNNELETLNKEIIELEKSAKSSPKKTVDYNQQLLNERISITNQLNEEFQKEIENWKDYNNNLTNKRIGSSIDQQMMTEVNDLNQQLRELQSSLKKHQKPNSTRKETIESSENELPLEIHYLKLHNQILQQNLNEMEKYEGFLITEIDQLYEKHLTSSPNEKNASSVWKMKLDEKRKIFNNSILSSMNLLSELKDEMKKTKEANSELQALKEENPGRKLNPELYENARKEKCDKYFYQNELLMIDQWINKVCPKIKPELSIEMKLRQLKKIINSLNLFSAQ